jgi:superfamily I DNA/RNA helicase
MLSRATSGRGLYLAFNKRIVEDSKEMFPENVDCSTISSFAYRAIAPRFRGRSEKMIGKMNAMYVVQLLGLSDAVIDNAYGITGSNLGYLILDTIRRFTQSEDGNIGIQHVAFPRSMVPAPDHRKLFVRQAICEAATELWGMMISESSDVPLGYGGFLKLWALSEPVIATDFILIDEAQDTNPVVFGVLKKQTAQIVYVGDTHQQIYEFLGAVDAMKHARTVHQTDLTQSFRFGSEIAAVATSVLRLLGENKRVLGNPSAPPGRIGAIDAPDVILCRTNASTMIVIMESLETGKHPHLVGGPKELKDLLNGVITLKKSNPTSVPDFFGFANWQEVVDFALSEDGAYLLMFVNLVQQHGELKLLWHLNRCVDEPKADIVVSTAHKVKGMQWNSVRLFDDFMKGKIQAESENQTPAKGQLLEMKEELRLIYVALTRAKTELELPETILQLLELR